MESQRLIPRESGRGVLVALVLIVLATAAVRIPLLDIPFERDEGEYAYISWRLGHDELPYRDWVDQKPPAVFWVYRLALSLPIDPVRSVHLMGLLFSAASAVALFFLARRFLTTPWAAAAAGLFALLSADPRVQGTAANTELFMLLPLILSLQAFLQALEGGRRRVLWMVLAGMLTGIALAFKQVAAVNWFFLVTVYPFFSEARERAKGTLWFAAWSALGGAAVWAVVAAYFAVHHAFGDLLYNVFTHNLEYVNVLPWSERLLLFRGTVAALARSQAIVWAFAAAGLLSLIRSQESRFLLLLAGWLGTGMIGVSASGYFFPHYFQQVLPALALAAAVGARVFFDLPVLRTVPSAARTALLNGVLAALPLVTLAPYLFTYTPAEAVRRIYPGNFFAEMPALADRIRKATGPEDRVFIFGAEPEVLFYARRVSATRYIFLFPLYGPYRDAREKQAAAAREVADARPAAALYLPNLLFTLPGSEQYFTEWSRTYLQEQFRSEAYLTVGPFGKPAVIGRIGADGPPLPAGHRIIGAVLVRPDGAGGGVR